MYIAKGGIDPFMRKREKKEKEKKETQRERERGRGRFPTIGGEPPLIQEEC
jgi:hypothetical protein